MSQAAYNSFLPTQNYNGRYALLSGLGWGIGYLGGILCMPLALFFIQGKNLPTDYGAYQAAFAIVAFYFLAFSIPSLFFMKDENIAERERDDYPTANPIHSVFQTIRRWRDHREVFKFLIGFYLINDGLSTLVFFTSIFASETLGLSTNQIMLAFLLLQIVAIPGTIAFSFLAEHIGYKKVLLVSVLLWILNILWCLTVETKMSFYLLSLSVGLVIGTTPSVARAILALMIDRENATEMYGFHAFAGRASSVLGPLLFGVVSSVSGNQRLALSSLVIFFVAGFIVLMRVQIPENIAAVTPKAATSSP